MQTQKINQLLKWLRNQNRIGEIRMKVNGEVVTGQIINSTLCILQIKGKGKGLS